MATPTDARRRPASERSASRDRSPASRSPRTAGPAMTDVAVRPAALARAWMGVDRAHETIAVPGVVLAPGEVLLRVELATIGETELAVVDGETAAPAPTVLGSEFVGRIAATAGRILAVDGVPLELGERVVCASQRPQRIAARHELVGAFATHVHVARGVALVRVGETLPACVLAPLAGATARAARLIREAEAAADLEGATVMISGAGATGFALAAMATERGATVSLAAPAPRTRTVGRRFGALAAPDERPDVVLFADRADAAAAFGPHDPPSDADLTAAVAFMRSPAARKYPFAELVSRPVGLERLDDALDLARSGTHVRVAIAPDA